VSEETEAWKEDADERMGAFIAENLNETMPMVRDWIIVVTYVDDEGNDATAFDCNPGQRRTATFGMLHHALAVQQAKVFWDEQPG
jgi:hypothetical protein